MTEPTTTQIQLTEKQFELLRRIDGPNGMEIDTFVLGSSPEEFAESFILEHELKLIWCSAVSLFANAYGRRVLADHTCPQCSKFKSADEETCGEARCHYDATNTSETDFDSYIHRGEVK